ncbi:MAG: hypothetical protein O3B84_08345, partial [Chloroflexi bacterium]|nr:hypothetical protein [Chloroflexota bacterium]
MADQIITVIDPGETLVRVLVARRRGDSVRVLTSREVPSPGFERGKAINLGAMARSIAMALRSAERDLGYPLEQAVLTVPASMISSAQLRAKVEPSGPGRTVRVGDAMRLADRAVARLQEGQVRILHVLPQGYVLDGIRYGGLPRARQGRELEMVGLALFANSTEIGTLIDAARLVGCEITGVIAAPVAGSMGALTQGERDHGAILVNIGHRHTSVVLAHGGDIAGVVSIPVGGFHLTNDLALALSVSIAEAEQIKLAHRSGGNGSMGRPTSQASSVEFNSAPPEVVEEILRDRLEETFRLCLQSMRAWGLDDVPTGGVVLAGRSAELEMCRALAREVFGTTVRIAMPRGMEAVPALA